MILRSLFLSVLLLSFMSCTSSGQTVTDAVVTTPAGSNLDFAGSSTSDDDLVRNYTGDDVILYLPFPANMATVTGASGEIDVVLLSPSITTGTELSVLPIGVMQLLIRGERVDKLIAVPADPSLRVIKSPSLEQLRLNYPGVIEILEIWFKNSDGEGMTEVLHIGDEKEAERRLREIL